MKNLSKILPKNSIRASRSSLLVAFFAVLYFVTSVAFIFPSGWEKCDSANKNCRIEIAQFHAHDAFWHLAIAETSFRSFPPIHPIFASQNLTHYNYFFDLLLSIVSFFGVSTLHGYFHFFPIFTSVFYILAVFLFINNFDYSSAEKAGVSLFLFLGNSFAFLMTLFSSGTLIGSSTRGFPLVLSLQPTIMFYNHQYALSLPIILIAVVYLKKRKESFLKMFVLGLFISLLTFIKVYAAVALLVLILSYLAFEMFINKTSFLYGATKAFIFLFFFFATSFLMSGSGSGVFSFDPLAFVRSMIDDPAHLYRRDISLARITLESSLKFSPRLVVMYTFFALAWYVINFGARIIGVFGILSIFGKTKTKPLKAAFYISTIILALIPLLFLQKGDWWNTIQFLYYGVFFAGIVSGEVVGRLRNKTRNIAYLIIVLTILIPFADQWRYTLKHDKIVITEDFIEATQALRKLPFNSVTTLGKLSQDSRIPAFTGFPLTIGNLPILRNTLIDYKTREKSFTSLGYDNTAFYIFADKEMSMIFADKLKFKAKVFENNSYVIYLNN